MPRGIDPGIISAGGEYRRVWDHFVEMFGDRLPDGAVALGERVGASWETVQTALYEGTPTTLCHGDFRADNLMFDDAATGREHVGILDWQIAYRSGGIGDICYLTTQSMTVEDRRTHERQLVDIWYDSVCSALGAPPDGYAAEDAWNDYRAATGNMTVYGVVAGGGMDPSNERGLELVTDMACRSFAAALDLDAASFIP
jgi:aminoglycoside/choline kinase family phosphotransferase